MAKKAHALLDCLVDFLFHVDDLGCGTSETRNVIVDQVQCLVHQCSDRILVIWTIVRRVQN